jgi:hypothetical protein
LPDVSLSRRGQGLRQFIALLPMLLLLWVFLGLRLHRIGEFPYFIDEMHHVNRARIVWSFSDLHVSTTPSKFLLYYYLGIFDLPWHLPGWLARSAVAVFSMLSLAASYGLARLLFSKQAGIVVALGLLAFPLMIFHERLALTDPFATALIMLMLWWGMLWMKRPNPQRSLLLGLLITLVLAAKLLAAPLIFLPLFAIIWLGPDRYRFRESLWAYLQQTWQKYRLPLRQTFQGVMVIWLVIMVFYVGRGLIDPDNTNPIVDDYIFETEDRSSQVEKNLDHIAEVFRYFWGESLLILNVMGVGMMLWRQPRRGVYLLAGIVPLWVALSMVAARPNSRYLALVGPLWMILMAGGLSLGAEWVSTRLGAILPQHPRWLKQALNALPSGVMGVWLVGFGLPYTARLIDDPISLDFPKAETRGYFQNITGYGLVPALETTAQLPPISEAYSQPVVVGIGRICGYWHYHIPSTTPLIIDCAPENYQRRVAFLEERLQTYQRFYLLQEEADHEMVYIDPPWLAQYAELVERFPRPHDGVSLALYRVVADGEQ